MHMADLFISYARADRPRCIQIRDALESLKLDIWFDAGIDAGDNFDRKIEAEIEAASGVMVLWSNTSVESDWVRNEARSGAERDRLVAVQLEECTLPLEFRSIHAEPLSEGAEKSGNAVWFRLLERIGKIVGRPGLASYAKLQTEGADVASWRAWLSQYADDPLGEEALDTVIGSANPEMRRQLAEEKAKRAALEAELDELRHSSKAHSGEIATSAREASRLKHDLDKAHNELSAAETEIDRLRETSGLSQSRGFWEGDQSAVGLVLDERLGMYVGALLWVLTAWFLWDPIKALMEDKAGVTTITLMIVGIALFLIPTVIVSIKIYLHRKAMVAEALVDPNYEEAAAQPKLEQGRSDAELENDASPNAAKQTHGD
jgi:hypothetical protein